MWNRTRAMSALALTVLAMSGAASAQEMGPAEIPPTTFAADEYVDSSGCAFVRVGVGDVVQWVPRVGPDRTPLCGLEPSLAAVAPEPAAPQPAEPEPEVAVTAVEEVTPPEPRVTPMTPEAVAVASPPPMAPAPARTAIRRAPPPIIVTVAGTTEARTLSGMRVTVRPVRILLPPTLTVSDVRMNEICPGRTGLALSYMAHQHARCVAELADASDVIHGTRLPRQSSHTPVARLRLEAPTAPRGYRVAWDDGRLNPYRGIRTEAGEAEMRMIWTDTVPRRLVPAD